MVSKIIVFTGFKNKSNKFLFELFLVWLCWVGVFIFSIKCKYTFTNQNNQNYTLWNKFIYFLVISKIEYDLLTACTFQLHILVFFYIAYDFPEFERVFYRFLVHRCVLVHAFPMRESQALTINAFIVCATKTGGWQTCS